MRTNIQPEEKPFNYRQVGYKDRRAAPVKGLRLFLNEKPRKPGRVSPRQRLGPDAGCLEEHGLSNPADAFHICPDANAD